MKEIKFRAWDKREGLHRMYFLNGILKYGEGWSGGDPKHKFYELSFGNGGFMKVVASDVEIMQYIGLPDKNGRDIYEDDILKPIDEDVFVIIKFIGGQFVGLSVDRKHPIQETQNRNWLSWEVVGNIWNNSDFLKS